MKKIGKGGDGNKIITISLARDIWKIYWGGGRKSMSGVEYFGKQMRGDSHQSQVINFVSDNRRDNYQKPGEGYMEVPPTHTKSQ